MPDDAMAHDLARSIRLEAGRYGRLEACRYERYRAYRSRRQASCLPYSGILPPA